MNARKISNHRLLLGAAIRRRRLALGLSQEMLAELADCHRNYVGKVERGEQNLTVDMLFRLAQALHSSPGELLDERINPGSSTRTLSYKKDRLRKNPGGNP